MTDDELHDLAALYAIDALEPQEAALFEAHLAACATCPADVRDYQEAMASALSEEFAAETATPSDDVRAAVLHTIADTPQLEPIAPALVSDEPSPVIDLTDRRRSLGQVVLAAAAAVMVLVGGAVAAMRLTADDPIDELVATADAQTLTLDGPAGTLTVVYSPERDEIALIGDGFDDPGVGKVYELWFATADGVSPATLFTPEQDGSLRDLFEVDDPSGTTGFGVTIEPEGGSDQPTSDILLFGEFEA